MKDLVQSTLKKITLEVVYNVVEERSRDIYTRIDDLEQKTSSRFDRLEDDVREIRTEMNRRFEAMDQRFTAMDQKFEQRFATMDQKFEQRFAAMDQKFAAMDQKFEQKFDALNARLDQIFSLFLNQRK